MPELRALPDVRKEQPVAVVRLPHLVRTVQDWRFPSVHTDDVLEPEETDKAARKTGTMVFALLWLHPEGDRKTFAEVLFRAVQE